MTEEKEISELGDRTFEQKCCECDQPIVIRGHNRLSNCGHMRKVSRGQFVPRDTGPKAEPGPLFEGFLNEQQWARIHVLTQQSIQDELQACDSCARRDRSRAELNDYIDSLKR